MLADFEPILAKELPECLDKIKSGEFTQSLRGMQSYGYYLFSVKKRHSNTEEELRLRE